MKNKFTFKQPKRNQPIWKIFKPILSWFACKKVDVIYTDSNIPNKCIIVGNHEGKSGPLVYDRYLPVFSVKWGAYYMLGSYKDRYNYLRNVLYIQKMGKSKFYATIKSSFEAIFSKRIYRGVKVIPSFPDARLIKTLKYSEEVLNNDMAVMVYPEDSAEGYFTKPTKFLNGFVMLADYYVSKNNEDIPICPVYLSKKDKKLVIGKATSFTSLKNQGLNNDEISEKFRLEVISLYENYIEK